MSDISPRFEASRSLRNSMSQTLKHLCRASLPNIFALHKWTLIKSHSRWIGRVCFDRWVLAQKLFYQIHFQPLENLWRLRKWSSKILRQKIGKQTGSCDNKISNSIGAIKNFYWRFVYRNDGQVNEANSALCPILKNFSSHWDVKIIYCKKI